MHLPRPVRSPFLLRGRRESHKGVEGSTRTRQHRVVFLPSGRTETVGHGATLYEATLRAHEPIETLCGGKGTCGKCIVQLVEGDMPAEITPGMQRHSLSPEVLACRTHATGDRVVFVPEKSRRFRPVVLKEAPARPLALMPAVRKLYLELPVEVGAEPSLRWKRLLTELGERFHLHGLHADPSVTASLATALEAGEGRITVTLRDAREIIRVEHGRRERAFGVAVDIGTTTIATYLCDLSSGEVLETASLLNPQVGLGEDVMTRLAAAMEKEGYARSRRVLLDGIDALLRDLLRRRNLHPEDICDVVVVGNTAMHHFFLGLDVRSLGQAPFAPSVDTPVDVKVRDVGIAALPSANVHVLPIEGGFVGADNVAVLIAEAPHRQDDILLLIDIGTNGEIVLGNRERLLCASCATGPALEGGCIAFGMRAAPGAIDRVRIDPTTLDVRVHVMGEDPSAKGWTGGTGARGICGSGIVDAVAEMLDAGILRENGAFEKERATPRLRQGADGIREFVIAWGADTAIGRDITVTQNDVRAVQLAKAALWSGCHILLRRLGRERPDGVLLAGAFGSRIDTARALRIGLFPPCPEERIRSVGNAAGTGAVLALLNGEKRGEAASIAREVEHVELIREPGFSRIFVEATRMPRPSGATGRKEGEPTHER